MLSFYLESQLLTVASFSEPLKYSCPCSSSYTQKTPVKLLKNHVHVWPFSSSSLLLGKSFISGETETIERERVCGAFLDQIYPCFHTQSFLSASSIHMLSGRLHAPSTFTNNPHYLT